MTIDLTGVTSDQSLGLVVVAVAVCCAIAFIIHSLTMTLREKYACRTAEAESRNREKQDD